MCDILSLSFGCTHPGIDTVAKGHQTYKISMIFTQKLTLFHVRGTASIMSFGVQRTIEVNAAVSFWSQ